MLTPYRLSAYRHLGEQFDTTILHGGTERNRTWSLNIPESLTCRKVWTLQIEMRKKNGISGVSDTAFVHINIGLLWWLPQSHPDVIVSHEMGLRTILAIIYGKLFRIPVWVWWGGTLHSEKNISKLRAYLRRILVKVVTRWISYGETTTEYLTSIGVPHRLILQIQNCVPQEVFLTPPLQPASWFSTSPKPIILTVGQLVQRKGLDKLIEACGRLSKSGYTFTLVIVGQGPEHQRLIEMASRNRIDNFIIIPNQAPPVLNEIYRAADVFVFPTLEDVWGLVVNEALWTGTPVLCSKYAGCAPELLPASNIFDPMSPDNFDSALSKIFDGSLGPPDLTRLKTWQEVGHTLCRALQKDIYEMGSSVPSNADRQ